MPYYCFVFIKIEITHQPLVAIPDIELTKKFFAVLQSLYGEPLMVAQWLRYCTTNRKVAGSIPDGVTGIFH
jgi:hypothetical protein